jgi:hypothetical protein
MATRYLSVDISLTETPHFRRLVEFATDVDDYAELTGDDDLAAMVDRLRADLLELRRH